MLFFSFTGILLKERWVDRHPSMPQLGQPKTSGYLKQHAKCQIPDRQASAFSTPPHFLFLSSPFSFFHSSEWKEKEVQWRQVGGQSVPHQSAARGSFFSQPHGWGQSCTTAKKAMVLDSSSIHGYGMEYSPDLPWDSICLQSQTLPGKRISW